MRANLPLDPRVKSLARMTNVSISEVLGSLFRLWSLDVEYGKTKGEDAVIPHLTEADLDEMTTEGFSRALQAVGWLEVSPEGLTLPRFREKQVDVGKRRQQWKRDKAAQRERQHATAESSRQQDVRLDTARPVSMDIRETSSKCPSSEKETDIETDTEQETDEQRDRDTQKQPSEQEQIRSEGSRQAIGLADRPDPSLPSSASKVAKGGRSASPVGPASIPFPPELNTPLFQEAWHQWIEYLRREKRRPLTTTSARKQLELLARAGEPASIDAINRSIANGYQGLFPNENHARGVAASRSTASRAERAAAEYAEPTTDIPMLGVRHSHVPSAPVRS
jgi:hypothetical protein